MAATRLEQSIAGRLREARKLAGLRQRELAEKLAVSPQQIQKYESGENRISAGRLWQLCKVLEMKPAYFFRDALYEDLGNRTTERREKRARSEELSAKVREIAEILEEIGDDEVSDAILTIVESYLASHR